MFSGMDRATSPRRPDSPLRQKSPRGKMASAAFQDYGASPARATEPMMDDRRGSSIADYAAPKLNAQRVNVTQKCLHNNTMKAHRQDDLLPPVREIYEPK